jgi:hypothetical protein
MPETPPDQIPIGPSEEAGTAEAPETRVLRQAPSQRALDAMAAAAQRARHTTARVPAAEDPRSRDVTAEIPPVRTPPDTKNGHGARPVQTLAPAGRPPRWVVRAFALGLLLVVVAGLTDVAITLTRSPVTARPALSASGGAARRGGSPKSKAPGSSNVTGTGRSRRTSIRTGARHRRRSHRPSTSSASPPSGPGSPSLRAVNPPRGRPGRVVVVSGTDFFSANGLVVARVGGQETRTDCPTRTSCDVTIPDLGSRPARVRLTITTETGKSNALWFRYL